MNDKQVGNGSIQYLTRQGYRPLEEVSLAYNRTRIDVVGMRDGVLCGFEIKSQADTLERLKRQASGTGDTSRSCTWSRPRVTSTAREGASSLLGDLGCTAVDERRAHRPQDAARAIAPREPTPEGAPLAT